MDLTAEDVAGLFELGLVLWLIALAGYTFYAVLLKGGAFRQMMCDATGRIAPERAGTFLIILAVAGYYLLTGMEPVVDPNDPDKYWMPDIPESLLIILAGGKSLFLAGKIARSQLK